MKQPTPASPGGPPPKEATKKSGKSPLMKEGAAPQQEVAPLSFSENLKLIARLRSHFLPYLLPAFGLLLLALFQADLALTATTAAQRVIDLLANPDATRVAGGVQGPGGTVTLSESVFNALTGDATALTLAGWMAAFLLTAQILGIGIEQVRTSVGERFRQRLQTNIVAALSRELAATRSKRDSGNTSQIFMTDASGLSGLLIFGIVRFAENVVKMGVYVYGLSRIQNGWVIVAVVFPVIVLFQSGVARLFLYRAARVTERSESVLVGLRSRTAEFFDNMSALVYSKGDRGEAEKLLSLSGKSGVANRRLQLLSSIEATIAGLIATLSLPLVIITLRSVGPVSPGIIIQAQSLVMLLVGTIGALVSIPSILAQFSPSLRRIEDILRIPEPEPEPTELAALRARSGPTHITLEDLTFAYAGSSETALKNFSLDIPAGASVGIIGRSGCGKSTLARLLIGDLKPSSGRILVDGVDVTNWHLVWRRELIGFMPAEPGFLRGTLEENVLFGRPWEAIGDWERGLEASGVSTIAAKRRDGMQFKIDGRVEAILSTGERKRIGIARLLVGTQRFAIFDEPGNGLDPQMMVEVASAFRTAMQGRTTLMITHDPDVFRNDFIVFLENGRIAGLGPHEELLRTNPEYARLVNRFAHEREEEAALAAVPADDGAGLPLEVPPGTPAYEIPGPGVLPPQPLIGKE
jgi:ABC-type multidrug transport system fused ATPase/permease subunit